MEAKKKFIVNVAFYGIIIIIIALLYKVIIPILMPFIIGFLVASLVQLMVRRVKPHSEKIRKALSIIFVIAFYLVIGGLIGALIVKLVTEAVDFARNVPGVFQNKIIPFLNAVTDYAGKFLSPIDAELATNINDFVNQFIAKMGEVIVEYSKSAVKLAANGIAGVPRLIVSVILTLVSTFYFAADYKRIVSFILSYIPKQKRSKLANGYRYGKKVAVAFFKSYFALFLLTWAELCAGFLILNIPYAVLIALAIAIFDILPVLGVGGILLPWAVIVAVMGNYKLGAGLLILYLVITVVRNTLESKIVGQQIGLHPLATLIAMILGLRLMGLVGMILFPITLVALANMKHISQEVKQEKAEKQK